MTRYRLFVVGVVVVSILMISGPAWSQQEHDHGHDEVPALEQEHDHSAHEKPAADEQHVEARDHDHGDDEVIVELTPEAVALAEITTSIVRHGGITRTIELPGEVGFNEDRLAHIAPRFPGVAMQALKRVGDYVEAGEVVAVVESNESMNPYSIASPISGWVIERHVTPGEFVSEENSIFVIADLSTVWVDLAVYPKDADRVRKGQVAHVRAIGSNLGTEGTIEYVTPVMDIHTRSLTARVVLPNPDNAWRPGSFVQATVAAEVAATGLVVEKEAVQYLDERTVVFVPDGHNSYRPVEVVTGESDHQHIRVTAGLDDGAEYVSNGAFELKAKIVTGSLGGHAGHGH